MKLYKVTWNHPDEGKCVHWAGSKTEAERALRSAINDLGKETDYQETGGPTSINAVEIPTDKEGLLKWLNTWFDRENG